VERHEKTHVLFLGLDDRMLWQLTRTLAHLEEQVTIDCVKDPSAAKEICDREVVHVIVVDGWEPAREAAHHMAGDEGFGSKPWKWIILVDSLPLEGLPAGELSPFAVFLEKPFNPKEFPSFLLEVVEERQARGAEIAPEPVTEKVSLPVTPGESYKEPPRPPPVEERTEGEVCQEIPTVEEVVEPAEPDAFYHHQDEGFACLSEKDWQGARQHWQEALKIRPDDERLKANLRRLERKIDSSP
jgi:hypothetical protein